MARGLDRLRRTARRNQAERGRRKQRGARRCPARRPRQRQGRMHDPAVGDRAPARAGDGRRGCERTAARGRACAPAIRHRGRGPRHATRRVWVHRVAVPRRGGLSARAIGSRRHMRRRVERGFAACLAAFADAARYFPSRIDGEVRFTGGRAVAWRELHDACNGGPSVVLAKSLRDVALLSLRQIWPRCDESRDASPTPLASRRLHSVAAGASGCRSHRSAGGARALPRSGAPSQAGIGEPR